MIGTAAVEAILNDNNGVLDSGAHRRLRSTIWRLCEQGKLVRVFPGIYVRAGTEQLALVWLAAVCAWRPGIVLTGEVAIALLTDKLPRLTRSLRRVIWHRPVRTRHDGSIKVRVRAIPEEDVVTIRGIRVHTALAAAVEAADTDAGKSIDLLLREARIDPQELEPHLATHRHTPGNRARRRVVQESMLKPYSIGERELHRLLHRAGISGWVANKALTLSGKVAIPDVLFADVRLVVEFDGVEFHGRKQFEIDRRRQNLLVRHKYHVLRITWDMLQNDPDYVITTVRETLRGLRSDAA